MKVLHEHFGNLNADQLNIYYNVIEVVDRGYRGKLVKHTSTRSYHLSYIQRQKIVLNVEDAESNVEIPRDIVYIISLMISFKLLILICWRTCMCSYFF
jgi:hypothetical protein